MQSLYTIDSRKGFEMLTKVMSKPFATLAALALASIMVVALGLSLNVGEAWAGGAPGAPTIKDLSGKSFTVMYKGEGYDTGYRYYSADKKKITNVSSSNPSVATAGAMHYGSYYGLQVQISSVGTTKISYKINGKKRSVNYVVKEYANPFASFKVGGKDYTSAFNPGSIKYSSAYVVAGSLSGKLSVKLAKGWKLVKAWVPGKKIKYVKNGSKISKTKSIGLYIKKGKQKEQIWLTAMSQASYNRLMATSL